MGNFAIQQRMKIVQLYFENQHPIVLTQRAYQREFNVRNPPSESMIRALNKTFSINRLWMIFQDLGDRFQLAIKTMNSGLTYLEECVDKSKGELVGKSSWMRDPKRWSLLMRYFL